MSAATPLDPEEVSTVTFPNEVWVGIVSTLMIVGSDLDDQESADLLMDAAADIIKQIDPAGWAETEPTTLEGTDQ